MAEKKATKRNWRFKDLTGQRFGRLTVIGFSHIQVRHTMWSCRCDCSAMCTVSYDNLFRGKQVSCGCYRKENTPLYTTTHGMVRTPEYESWQHAKSRCFNPDDSSFHRYGARGISMSSEWVCSFEAFYSDMGPRPTIDHSLDRIDNDGPYTGPCAEYPSGNCRWATKLEQNNNRRPRMSSVKR